MARCIKLICNTTQSDRPVGSQILKSVGVVGWNVLRARLLNLGVTNDCELSSVSPRCHEVYNNGT